jgi:HTH-type transcriptional regulator/antitoxin HigA
MKAQLIVVETPEDYEAARALVSKLMNATTSEDGARLRAQVAIVAAYEARIRLPRPVDPIEAIKFRMDQTGMKRADLVRIIGSKSKVSEILNRKRPLSLAMIRRLHKELKIPADVLIKAA